MFLLHHGYRVQFVQYSYTHLISAAQVSLRFSWYSVRDSGVSTGVSLTTAFRMPRFLLEYQP